MEISKDFQGLENSRENDSKLRIIKLLLNFINLINKGR